MFQLVQILGVEFPFYPSLSERGLGRGLVLALATQVPTPDFNSQDPYEKPDVEVCACDPKIGKAELGGILAHTDQPA